MPKCPQPNGLADVLCGAPALLAMLSSEDRTVLSSCGRELRHMIHSLITTIVVNDVTSVEAVLRGSWPQLALIKVPTCCLSGLSLPPESNFKVVARFQDFWESSSALVVRPKGEHHQHHSISMAFRQLQSWGVGSHGVIACCVDEGVIPQMAHLYRHV